MKEAPTTQANARPTSGPTTSAERITSLDLIRGVAILGILPMNALVFGLDRAAYFNVSADGIGQPLDWIIGVLTMIFIDQKMMALFSLLFGVGVVIFAERAAAKGRRVVWLSLWRFALLFAVGMAHAALWFGDILALYAMCAPIVLLLRKLPARLLAAAGVGSPWSAPCSHRSSRRRGCRPRRTRRLLVRWTPPPCRRRWSPGSSSTPRASTRAHAHRGRALPARHRPRRTQRRLLPAPRLWGLGAGGAVTAVGSALHIATDWSADYALTGTIPTGLGTIPMALGYMAAIILWNRSGSRHLERFRNAGRMALTNYLTQTVIGLATLGWLLDDVDLTRTMIAVWILAVWALQLWWSTWWLERFRYGPFEWAWRCGTYRSWQPLRRRPSTS